MPILLVGSLLALVAAVVLVKAASAWIKYRGNRVIQCPENLRPAGVRVDAAHAAVTALGKKELRLRECSRWPERAGCGQECLAQIEASPEDCLVRNIIATWYRGKVCVSCHRAIGEIDWAGSQPGLLTASGKTVAWQDIPAAEIPGTLDSAQAICFTCHTAATLVREYPELATDRHR